MNPHRANDEGVHAAVVLSGVSVANGHFEAIFEPTLFFGVGDNPFGFGFYPSGIRMQRE